MRDHIPDDEQRSGGTRAAVDSALRRARVTQFGVELLLPNEAIAPEPPPTAAGRSYVVTAG